MGIPTSYVTNSVWQDRQPDVVPWLYTNPQSYMMKVLQSPVRRFDSARRLFVKAQVGAGVRLCCRSDAVAPWHTDGTAQFERRRTGTDFGARRAASITSSR
jgi:hypothetical protein